MDIQDLTSLFRKQVSDQEAPYLWDDDEVLTYIIDAQDQLVRVLGGFSDNTTTDLTDIAVTATDPWSNYSPYILRIRSGKLLTAKRGVSIVSEADWQKSHGSYTLTRDYGNILTQPIFMDDTDTGIITEGIIGMNENKLRWWRVPADDDTFRMHIYRLPYPRIIDQEGELEVDEQHHIHLLLWVKAMAYSKEDGETYDKDLAEKYEEKFKEYCKKFFREKERQNYKPRVVGYGGL